MLFSLLVVGIALTTTSGAADQPAPSPSWLPSQIAIVEVSETDPGRPVLAWRVLEDATIRPAALGPGTSDLRWVSQLQRHLTALGVYRGEIDGVYGREVSASVVAVHKLAGVERTDVWGRADWGLDLDHSAILERHPDEPDRIEVDITRQVLFIIRDGEIAAILPVSSGNGEVYWSRGSGGRYVRASTPRGDFTLFKHIDGWRHNYLGALYKPWYFTPYYAIHGSSSVPAYPASHGCVRVPNWEADNLDGLLRLGLPVHTWDA